VLSLDAHEFDRLEPGETGVETRLIHLPNSIPPEPEERRIYARRLPEAVDHVVRRLERNSGALLVHCHAGNDRTGGVLTGYLCRIRGWSPAQALARVREIHPEAITAPGYEEMILSVLEREKGRP
jgi:protein-tyrosine phosphatase